MEKLKLEPTAERLLGIAKKAKRLETEFYEEMKSFYGEKDASDYFSEKYDEIASLKTLALDIAFDVISETFLNEEN